MFAVVDNEAKWLDDEVYDYLLRTHSEKEILEDWVKLVYNEYSNEWKDDFKKEFNIDGEVTADSILNSFSPEEEKEKRYFIDDSIDELTSDFDIYYDELLDYFEDDAEKEFYRD